MTEKELLEVPVHIYNQAMESSWEKKHKDSVKSNEPIKLRTCKHCGRLYDFACICPEGKQDWEDMLTEVREVSEQNNREREKKYHRDIINEWRRLSDYDEHTEGYGLVRISDVHTILDYIVELENR